MFVRLMSGLKNLNRSIVYINLNECLTNISLKNLKLPENLNQVPVLCSLVSYSFGLSCIHVIFGMLLKFDSTSLPPRIDPLYTSFAIVVC